MTRNEILKKIGLDVPAEARLRVLVDTDAKNEADDQFAIMHHLLTPLFDIRGIVATHFEQKDGYRGESMGKSYREVEKLLKLAQIDDVPYFRGCVSPLSSVSDAPVCEGVEQIIREARAPGKLYIAVQGAMTNVAAALNAAPEIAGNVVVLWNGGGPYPHGLEEFNVKQDPDAARAVLNSGAEIWQTPMNVYGTLEVTLAELKRRVFPCGPLGAYLYRQLEAENHVEYNPGFLLRSGENWTLGDNTTIAVLIMNAWRGNWHTEPAPILKEDLTYQANPSGRPIRVYDAIDVRMTLEDLFCKIELAYGEERCADRGPADQSSKIRETEASDPCFLTEQDFLSSGILEDMLKQNHIPYLKKDVMGAGMAIKVGPMLERSRFYVPSEHLSSAKAIMEDLFSAAEEADPDDP